MRKWLKSTDCIKFEVANHVARITLNRPEKRNAMNTTMIRELHEAMLEADDLVDVRVIILDGAGKDFCAGADLTSVYAKREEDQQDHEATSEAAKYRTMIGSFDDDCWQLERQQSQSAIMFDVHKPVIAKIHGSCVAGATDIVLLCDIVIAATDARIGFPAARANGSPPNHMWFYHVGPQWAKRLLFTGDCISGKDAATIGLVLDAVPPERLDAETNELARRISCIDPEMLSAHKRIVNLALELSGSRTLLRLSGEADARAHLSQGPRRTQFRLDMRERGLKSALKSRDEPFGDGMVRIERDHSKGLE